MVPTTRIHDDCPTLYELLSDPLTQAVMKADRVDPAKLKAMLRSVAREITARSGSAGGSAAAFVKAESAKFERTSFDQLLQPIDVYRDTACGWVSGSRIYSQWPGVF
jgi:hypothetical protein